ncbi:lysophosphatidic acid receptor 1-A-like [Oculina patagonica]
MLNTAAIIFIVVYVVEVAVIIIGNIFTIYVFWTQRLHLKRAYFLLINLSVADLLVGIAEAVVLAIVKPPNIDDETEITYYPWTAFQVFGSLTSVFFLALISLERVYAVLWPLRHRVISTRAYIYSILFVWLLGLCMAGQWLAIIYHPKVDNMYASVTSTAFLLISLFIICSSYLTIRSRLRSTAPALEAHNQNLRERNLRFSKTFFIVVAVSLVFWFPAFVVYTMNYFCSQCVSRTEQSGVKILHLANSLVNPFVYSFRIPMFKETLKRWCGRRVENVETRAVSQNVKNEAPEFTTHL